MADPADVVAGEVDEHEVLGGFLLVGQQILLQFLVLGFSGSTVPGAGNGTDFNLVSGQAHMHFGGGANDGKIGILQKEHVGGGVYGAEGAVEVDWRRLKFFFKAL